jgi:hypothetical protein
LIDYRDFDRLVLRQDERRARNNGGIERRRPGAFL